jgi:pimeloyl-ACP methyl ester carboxylesterase
MSSRLLPLLLLPALAYAGLSGAMYLGQRELIYYPQPRALPAGEHELILETADARLQVSVRARRGAPALIYFGGNAEDVSRTLPELARHLPEHALYLLHYRGYGGSSGHPSEENLFADAEALYEHVAARHPQVEVIGRSLGSGVAVHLASRRPLSRLVLVTPFDSLAAVAEERFPWLPMDWLLQDRYDSAQFAPRVNAPTLLLVGAEDTLVRPERSEVLRRAFRHAAVELRVLAGVDHNTISLHPDYAAALAGQPANAP